MQWLTLSTTGAVDSPLGLSTDGMLCGAGLGLAIVALDEPVLGDDGGWELKLTGMFPMWQGTYIEVSDPGPDPTFTGRRRCHSGVQGQGDLCNSKFGVNVTCVIPPLPIGAHAYDVHAVSEDGLFAAVLAGSLTIIHRSFTTKLYSYRSAFPPPRDVGPYSIDGED